MNIINHFSVQTINRSVQQTQENKSMLELAKGYKSKVSGKVLLAIANFFFKAGDAWCDYHSNKKEEGLAHIFAQIACIDLDKVQNNFFLVDSDQGKIRFEQINEFGESKIKVFIGEESIVLENVTTFSDLQNRIRDDIQNNSYGYIKSGAIEVTSFSKKFEGINRHNIASEKKAHGGKVSTVTEITYKNGKVYFFKPIGVANNKQVTSALISGIPIENNRFADRSMFVYKMSEVLGFHVVPKTGLSENEKGVAGYIQEKAEGIPGQKYLQELKNDGELNSLKSNGEIIRQLIEIQLLDALTGQTDRHMNNYFIDKATNKVSCIDNDASGGFLFTHPHNMLKTHRTDGYLSKDRLTEREKKSVIHLRNQNFSHPISKLRRTESFGFAVLLPPVMDRNMVEKFKNLSERNLVNYMSQFDFNQEEKEAACSRLEAIQFHIEVLEKRQACMVLHPELKALSIIEQNEWSSPETIARLFPQEAREKLLPEDIRKELSPESENSGYALQVFTSYLQRDMATIANKMANYDKKSEIHQARVLR